MKRDPNVGLASNILVEQRAAVYKPMEAALFLLFDQGITLMAISGYDIAV